MHRVLVLVLVLGCSAPMPNAKIQDSQKSKTLGHIDEAGGPSPEDQLPPRLGNDRKLEQLSYPVFPAGEVRFERELDDAVTGGAGEPRKKATPVLCTADEECKAPDKCLRPAGSPGFGGVCGQAFGAGGEVDDTQRYVESCKEAWQCPEGYDCVKVNGPYGLCIKLREE